jgi:hypothetical protein
MTLRFTKILMLFLVWSFAQIACAQESRNSDWDAQKIKGVRQLPYPSYTGFPFLTNEWCLGKVEFTNGEISDSLFVRYSSYKDELIYYNKIAGAQISIDKASIKGFEFIDADGSTRSFRKQYFDDFMKGDRYFEILSSGETTLLAYRKVGLNTTSAYHDVSGILKNMAYDLAYQFYFYSPEKGYTLVRISQSGLLAKFDKAMQKPIKKLLRKNRIKIDGESSFILAWKAVEKEGYKVVF